MNVLHRMSELSRSLIIVDEPEREVREKERGLQRKTADINGREREAIKDRAANVSLSGQDNSWLNERDDTFSGKFL